MADVFFERSPLQQAIKHRAERLAPFRQAVFDFWRHLMVDDPAHDAVSLHLAKLLEEGRVRHEGDDQLTGYVAI